MKTTAGIALVATLLVATPVFAIDAGLRDTTQQLQGSFNADAELLEKPSSGDDSVPPPRTEHTNFDSSNKQPQPDLNLQSSGCKYWEVIDVYDYYDYHRDRYTQGQYPNDAFDCYVFKAPHGRKIELEVTYLDLETGYDELHIHDIDSYSTYSKTTTGKRHIKTYSGSVDSNNPITSSGNLLFATFVTDYSNVGYGWTVRVKSVPGAVSPSNCSFIYIGRGYCRTSTSGKGTYDLVCSKSRGYPCTLQDCKDRCAQNHRCTGIEYRSQSCELHTGDVSMVKYGRNSKCYKYEC